MKSLRVHWVKSLACHARSSVKKKACSTDGKSGRRVRRMAREARRGEGLGPPNAVGRLTRVSSTAASTRLWAPRMLSRMPSNMLAAAVTSMAATTVSSTRSGTSASSESSPPARTRRVAVREVVLGPRGLGMGGSGSEAPSSGASCPPDSPPPARPVARSRCTDALPLPNAVRCWYCCNARTARTLTFNGEAAGAGGVGGVSQGLEPRGREPPVPAGATGATDAPPRRAGGRPRGLSAQPPAGARQAGRSGSRTNLGFSRVQQVADAGILGRPLLAADAGPVAGIRFVVGGRRHERAQAVVQICTSEGSGPWKIGFDWFRARCSRAAAVPGLVPAVRAPLIWENHGTAPK